MIKLLKHMKAKEWGFFLISVLFVVFQVWIDLKIPDYMKEITVLVQSEGDQLNGILREGVYMMLCALGSLLSAIIVGYFASTVAASFSGRLRGLVYNKVGSFSMEELNKFSVGSLITRSTNDITQIQTIVATGLQVLIKAPIMAVWAIAKIAGKGFEWSLATAIAVVVLVVLLSTIISFVLPKFKVVQQLIDDINNVTRENLSGLRVVRAYNAEEYQEEKFKKTNDKLTKTNLFTSRVMGLMMPGMMLISNGLTLSIYWIGAQLINNAGLFAQKTLLFGDMIVFSSYAMQVVMSFMMLVMIFIIMPRAMISAKRINEILDTEPSIIDGTITEGTGLIGEVEFKNVSFKYPDASEYIIKDISFVAKQGETVAFIGSTGSGKSTLINLVPRFYDATDGEVLVDGVNVKDYSQEALYNKIGYVPQKAVMFSGTVQSNVAMGDNGKAPAVLEDVKRAVAIAQGTDFVENLENQYDGSIAQGGTNLSGGQKQRLSIARAVCRDPEIFIFDDSFSALDYKTDRDLRTELKKQTANTTSLIVAQRIGTIIDADKILVLDNGALVGIGTHKQLLQSCDVYQEIAYSQLSKEELA